MMSMAAVLVFGMPTAEYYFASTPTFESRRDRLSELDLDPQIRDESPVLQRWLEATPDLDTEIRHDSTVRSRLRVGYSQALSDEGSGEGWIGVEDVFVGDTSLSASGEYRLSLDEADASSYGVELRYYLQPLGSRLNLAPVVGYRSIETDSYEVDGLTLGLRLAMALSRNGASDLTVSQTWVNPGGEDELGLTVVSTGYAVTAHARIGTEIQILNNPNATQYRVGVGLEWLF